MGVAMIGEGVIMLNDHSSCVSIHFRACVWVYGMYVCVNIWCVGVCVRTWCVCVCV